jgi:hypothetical protein
LLVLLAFVPLTGVVSDDKLIFSAALVAFAGHRAGRGNLLNLEAFVKLADKWRVGI